MEQVASLTGRVREFEATRKAAEKEHAKAAQATAVQERQREELSQRVDKSERACAELRACATLAQQRARENEDKVARLESEIHTERQSAVAAVDGLVVDQRHRAPARKGNGPLGADHRDSAGRPFSTTVGQPPWSLILGDREAPAHPRHPSAQINRSLLPTCAGKSRSP